MDIIYEDNHQLVVNKPSGILTQPSGTTQTNLEEQAKQWLKQKYNKSGNVFLHVVHRLDKPASGIVLFAKTSKSLSRLQASMRQKQTRKIYLALVEGILPHPEGTLEHYLTHDDYYAKVSSSSQSDAKLARLTYRLLKTSGHLSLLEITLETGRYHQIRAQLSAIDCPIIGDEKYGSHFIYKPESIALHHYHLEIPHPISNQLQCFEATIPHDWPLNK